MRLNNIETAQSLLMEFSSVIEKKLDDNDVEPLFDVSFNYVKNSLSKMIDILSDKVTIPFRYYYFIRYQKLNYL